MLGKPHRCTDRERVGEAGHNVLISLIIVGTVTLTVQERYLATLSKKIIAQYFYIGEKIRISVS